MSPMLKQSWPRASWAVRNRRLLAPDKKFDIAIDRKYEIVEIGEQSYYVSELLFAIDYAAYRDLGARLVWPWAPSSEDEDTEGHS